MSTSKLAALRARVAALQVKIAELEAKGEAGDFIAKQGDVVVYLFGRGENVQEYTGTVLGVRQPAEGEKGGTIVKIITGEGYDAEVRGVFMSKVLRLASDPAPEVGDVAATGDDADLELGEGEAA